MVRASSVRIAYGTHGTYRQHPVPPTHPQLLLLPRSVGTYLVAVTLNDEPILGSRFALRVHEDAADPASCVAAGAGLRRGRGTAASTRGSDAAGTSFLPR